MSSAISTGWVYTFNNVFGELYWIFGKDGSSSNTTCTLSKVNADYSQTVVTSNLPFGGAWLICGYHEKIHMCYCLDDYKNSKHYMFANGVLTQLSDMPQCSYTTSYKDVFVLDDRMLLIRANLRYMYNEDSDSWTKITGTIVSSNFELGEFFQYEDRLYSICSKGSKSSKEYDIYEIYTRYNVRK